MYFILLLLNINLKNLLGGKATTDNSEKPERNASNSKGIII